MIFQSSMSLGKSRCDIPNGQQDYYVRSKMHITRYGCCNTKNMMIIKEANIMALFMLLDDKFILPKGVFWTTLQLRTMEIANWSPPFNICHTNTCTTYNVVYNNKPCDSTCSNNWNCQNSTHFRFDKLDRRLRRSQVA